MTAHTEAPASPESTTRRRVGSFLPWVVTLAAIGLAVFSTVQWRALASEEAARAEVESAAGAFLLELTTWDASDGLVGTRDRLAELGTGGFVEEVDRLFGADLSAGLQNARATSRGEIQDLFLQRLEGDRAVVFAVVLQTQDTAETDPDTIARSARVTLERVDGSWKIASVDMVDAGTTGLGTVAPDPEPGDGS